MLLRTAVISHLFRTKKWRFEKIFDNLTFKRMDSLRKMIQSLSDYVIYQRLFLQILTMAMRNKLLSKSFLVCSDIKERYGTG